MKICDLIEQLRKFPYNLDVIVSTAEDSSENHDFRIIGEIHEISTDKTHVLISIVGDANYMSQKFNTVGN